MDTQTRSLLSLRLRHNSEKRKREQKNGAFNFLGITLLTDCTTKRALGISVTQRKAEKKKKKKKKKKQSRDNDLKTYCEAGSAVETSCRVGEQTKNASVCRTLGRVADTLRQSHAE